MARRSDDTRELTEAEFKALKKATGHTCPPWCHRCPLMPGREVMPWCYGTIYATNGYDLSRCTCDRPKRDPRAVETRVEILEKRVAELEAMVAKLTAATV